MNKKKLTYEELLEFLTNFEPISIAWKLKITSKGISPRENNFIMAYNETNMEEYRNE